MTKGAWPSRSGLPIGFHRRLILVPDTFCKIIFVPRSGLSGLWVARKIKEFPKRRRERLQKRWQEVANNGLFHCRHCTFKIVPALSKERSSAVVQDGHTVAMVMLRLCRLAWPPCVQ